MTLAQALNILVMAAQYRQVYGLDSPTFLDRPNGLVAVMFTAAGTFNSPEELEAYCRGYGNGGGNPISQQAQPPHAEAQEAHAEAQEGQEEPQHGGH